MDNILMWARRSSTGFVDWALLIFFAFAVLIAFIAFIAIAAVAENIIVSRNMQPSKVDISPIAQLSEEQVALIEDAVIRVGNLDFIFEPRIRELPDNHIELIRIYSTGWREEVSPHPATSLRVGVTVYKREDTAIQRMQLEQRNHDRFGEPYTVIVNDNNTEAVMRYPFMPTCSGGWHIPTAERNINSVIRFGNVVISLRESRHRNNMDHDLSSRYIALLVEMLRD